MQNGSLVARRAKQWKGLQDALGLARGGGSEKLIVTGERIPHNLRTLFLQRSVRGGMQAGMVVSGRVLCRVDAGSRSTATDAYKLRKRSHRTFRAGFGRVRALSQ